MLIGYRTATCVPQLEGTEALNAETHHSFDVSRERASITDGESGLRVVEILEPLLSRCQARTVSRINNEFSRLPDDSFVT